MRERVGADGDGALLSAAALDGQPDAVFVVDAQGRPLLMNRQAEALVARADGLIVTRIGLRARRAAQGRALTDAVARACVRPGAQGAALSITRAGAPALRVLVTPLEADGARHALVVVNDPARNDPRQVDNLRGYYGLSGAEAETAVALARGLSPQAVAAARGVSMPTIRTQIRHALRKTDARGIPELVALVASAPTRAP